MAEVLLFHHAQGLTDGVVAFAGELRSAGHTVHTPDLYDGNTFASLDDGMAYADELTFDTVIARGHEAAEGLGEDLVYVGFSLGRELAGSVAGAELFLYPGDRHLFTDASLPDHDPDAAALVRDRVRSFLGALGQRPSRGSSIAGQRSMTTNRPASRARRAAASSTCARDPVRGAVGRGFVADDGSGAGGGEDLPDDLVVGVQRRRHRRVLARA